MKLSRASKYGEYSTEAGHTANKGYPPGVSCGELSPLFDFSRKPWLLLGDTLRLLTLAHTVLHWTELTPVWGNKGKGRTVKLLDVACGYGELYTLLRDARKVKGGNFDYLGIDLDVEKVMVGNTLRPGANLETMDLNRIWALPSDWDVVVSGDTLEHVTREEGVDFIDNVAGIVKPDGLFILTVPTPAMSIRATRKFHVFEWPRTELIAELELAGFIVLDDFPIMLHANDWDIDVGKRLPTDIVRPTAGALRPGTEGVNTLVVARREG